MALKVLLMKNKLDARKHELSELQAKDAEFEKRTAEIEAAVEEMTTETTDEERAAIEAAAETLAAEQEAHEEAKKTLEAEIREIEDGIKAEEEQQRAATKSMEKRKDEFKTMETRKKFFGMNMQERDMFFAREDVKEFLERTRELMAQKRSITGADLLIPTVVLELIRENITEYSKLINRVRTVRVGGKARQTVMGTIPEAVWTEMCANLNEMDLVFNAVELDGYKVGAYVAICNAVLEDSDIDLAAEIITALAQGIGLALDKAILFGDGTRMPLGIATRLAQTTEPSDYPASARPWVDLSTTNVIDVAGTGEALFKDLIMATAAAKGNYSRGVKFWAMNEATYSYILSQAVALNGFGTYVSNVGGVMPIIGGDIVVLSFIPENTIIGGYGDLYILAERAGTSIARSEEYRFVEDQTVFKATARYDGLPVIAEAFVALTVNGGTFSPDMEFAPDLNNNSTLSALELSDVSLTFDPATYDYTADVANTVTATSVTATPAVADADVKINVGTKKYAVGANIPLAVGENVIKITVANGATKTTYTVTVTRA